MRRHEIARTHFLRGITHLFLTCLCIDPRLGEEFTGEGRGLHRHSRPACGAPGPQGARRAAHPRPRHVLLRHRRLSGIPAYNMHAFFHRFTAWFQKDIYPQSWYLQPRGACSGRSAGVYGAVNNKTIVRCDNYHRRRLPQVAAAQAAAKVNTDSSYSAWRARMESVRKNIECF